MMSPILILSALGFGAYFLLRKESPFRATCPVKNPELDNWANSFAPPLGVYKLDIRGVPPSIEVLEDMLIGNNIASLPGNFVVINVEDDFYVYSADGIPRLSDNLKYSYCRFYEQGGFG